MARIVGSKRRAGGVDRGSAKGAPERTPHRNSRELRWPENMEDLTSLEKVVMTNCNNIHSLPNLPRSLKEFLLNGEDLMRDDCSRPAASI